MLLGGVVGALFKSKRNADAIFGSSNTANDNQLRTSRREKRSRDEESVADKENADPVPVPVKRIRRRTAEIPVVDIPPVPSSVPSSSSAAPVVPASNELDEAKALILGRLNERLVPEEIIGQQDHISHLRNMMIAAVESNESNSALIVGNRGAGKSMIIRKLLAEIREKYDGNNRPFHVIHLNGLIHTDDRLALQEMVQALHLDEQIDLPSFSSFPEAFLSVFDALKQSQQGKIVPTIFILDEFDLFTLHNKQALLYNLFDSVQSGHNAMCVIGLTCRQDVLELLEKRVKSRFSHRLFYLASLSYELFQELIEKTLLLPQSGSQKISQRFVKEFNQSIKDLFQDVSFIKILKRVFSVHANVRPLYKVLMQAVSQLGPDSQLLTPALVYDSFVKQNVDSKSEQMRGLSLLEICLLIAMKRLKQQDLSSFNFEMIYDVYYEFATLHNISFKKAVAFKAFENLMEMELIQPSESFSKCPKEYRMVRLFLQPEQITEAVLKSNSLPYVVKRWGSENFD